MVTLATYLLVVKICASEVSLKCNMILLPETYSEIARCDVDAKRLMDFFPEMESYLCAKVK